MNMNRFRCRLQLNLNTFAGVRHPCRSGSGRRHTSFTRFFKARLGTLRLRITKVGLFPELTNLFHSRFARRKRRKAHAATGAEPANHASANHFVKPSAEPNEVRAMARREMDERNSRIFVSGVIHETGEYPRRGYSPVFAYSGLGTTSRSPCRWPENLRL